MMSHRVLNFAGAFGAALWLLATPSAAVNSPAFAQNNDAKPADQLAAPKDAAKEPQKVDEYVEA
ncbi:MAG TPA: hypothetical protein VF778_06275, partial [Xanthobacteraceae bacterium]